MSFQQFNGYGGQARRENNNVNIYLMGKQPVPDMVPFELRDHITPDDWHSRLTSLRDLSMRFYHPIFERVWLFIATIVTIVLPFALYSVIFNSLTKGIDFDTVDDEQNSELANKVFKARAISSAAFIGTILVFWLPMFIWKLIGKSRLRNLCASFYKKDSSAANAGSFIPVWTANLPSVFRSSCLVTISIPPNTSPSVFHPNAYVPPYVNPPKDGGAPYYYPYSAGQDGLPRMSVAGTLPAYQPQPGKEKYFEDIKV